VNTPGLGNAGCKRLPSRVTLVTLVTGEPSERLNLRDGRVVDIRALERGDRRLLAAAIRRLSDRSSYLRFATPKHRVTERELDYLVDIDHHDHEALLAIDPLTGRGVAVARYVQVSGEPGVVELAATVADDWQGIGLGSALLARLTRRAVDEGHSAFRAYVLAVNGQAIAVLRRAGFRARPGWGALIEYELSLVAIADVKPTPPVQNSAPGPTIRAAAVVIRPAKRNAVWRSDDSRSKGSSAEIASRGITTSYQRSAALAAV
jgi:RimJ/RimL family protein N-acetyltransferase